MGQEDIIDDSSASEDLLNDINYIKNIEDTKRITVELSDGNKFRKNRQGIVRVVLYKNPEDQGVIY